MTPDLLMLCELLGCVDGVFAPYRGQNNSVAVAIMEERGHYVRDGIKMPAGPTASDRQARSRTLGRLKKQGLVTASGGSTHLRVKLTTRGADTAAALTATYSICDPRVRALHAHVVALQEKSGAAEYIFFGRYKITSKEAAGVEHIALPLLSADVLHSNADCYGRVQYSGDPGWRAPDWHRFEGFPTFNDACSDEYDAAFRQTLEARNRWLPANHHEVHIPLSAGLWEPVGRTEKRLAKQYRPQWDRPLTDEE